MSDTQTQLNRRRQFPATAVVESYPLRDGWPVRRVIWPAPAVALRGSFLFMGGRGDHMEKYLETFDDLRASGWQIESFDWRGQGGSGRIGADPNIGHIDDFGIWVDDLAEYVAAWRARTPPPHVVAGHSMGGHLLLRTLAEGRITPDAAVLVAPMLGFTTPVPNRLGLLTSDILCRIGGPGRAAWKYSEKPGAHARDRQKLLTHDDGRYSDELWWHMQQPALALGPASWGWVRAAYRSYVAMDQKGALEGIATPLLALVASQDELVSAKATRRLVGRIPGAQLHSYGPEAAHEVLREVDAIRNDALARIDAFLPR